MSLSGTTTFNLDLAEILEEAAERCGMELRTGYAFKTARRSLGLLLGGAKTGALARVNPRARLASATCPRKPARP